MKKYIPILIVFVLVLTIVGLSRNSSVWAGPNASGANAPLKVIKTVTADGTNNLGGICTLTTDFTAEGFKTVADAEVPVKQSSLVPFNPPPQPGYSEEWLLFPGCHFVNYKLDQNQQWQIQEPLDPNDVTAKVCFGASPILTMRIYYYLDNPPSGTKAWILLPTTLENNEKLVCAPAQHTGVYMPSGSYLLDPSLARGGEGGGGGGGRGGSVVPPPSEVSFSTPGTYAVGGICTITAKYNVTGLSDTVAVEFAEKHLTEETLKVLPDVVQGVFYFPGCHVIHYLDAVIQDQMQDPDQGQWQICFAAIPSKDMTIYYYKDDLTTITGPWVALESTTKAGKVCADLVDFSGVYVPAGVDKPNK